MKKPLIAPHGFEEIIEKFGDIREYIGPDWHLAASWQMNYLGRVSLPFPLRLAWDRSQTITQMTCHRRMTSAFADVFGTIQDRGLQASVTSFGGCFAFRPQRTGSKLSTHSWGIAIDLNSFHSAGFEWGGDWQGANRDPTHFQF
jgi:hypothetical protein